MTLGESVLAAWAGIVVLSLLGIGLFFLAGVVVSALTVANARRARSRSHHLDALARWCSASELAELDEALDRLWTGNGGTMVGRPAR